MLKSGRIVWLTCIRSIKCYKCGEERGVWWSMAESLPSKLRRGKSMWVMCGFEFRFCLSPSFSQLEFWSVDCRLPSFDLFLLLRNLSFISFFSSDQIRLRILCFLPWRSRIGWKITFNYFYFLTNFIDISLCTDPVRRNPFFPFWRKVSALITSSECSRGC